MHTRRRTAPLNCSLTPLPSPQKMDPSGFPDADPERSRSMLGGGAGVGDGFRECHGTRRPEKRPDLSDPRHLPFRTQSRPHPSPTPNPRHRCLKSQKNQTRSFLRFVGRHDSGTDGTRRTWKEPGREDGIRPKPSGTPKSFSGFRDPCLFPLRSNSRTPPCPCVSVVPGLPSTLVPLHRFDEVRPVS